jgi:hypothetical protein
MWNGQTWFLALAIATLITVFYPTKRSPYNQEESSSHYAKLKLFVLSLAAAYAVLYFAKTTKKSISGGGKITGLDEVMQNIQTGEPEF